MLSYHRTCGMLSVFGFQVIDVLLRLLIIVQTVGRDFLNILWGLKLLFSYKFTLKMFCFGAIHGFIIGKMLDVYFTNSIFKAPVAIIAFYCMSRLLTYYKNYVLLDKDPLTYLTGEEAERLKRALSYIGFGDRYQHLEDPKRVEFISDWHAYQRDLYSQIAVRQLAATYNSGSDEDDEKSDSDASSDLVECDHCGEKNIDPNELLSSNIGEAKLNLNKMTIKIQNKVRKINLSEKKVLMKMLSSPGKIFSRAEIGKISNIFKERSIDVMITRLRKKIEIDPKNPKYLQTIRGSGYVLWVK